jgi:hypothetical protein
MSVDTPGGNAVFMAPPHRVTAPSRREKRQRFCASCGEAFETSWGRFCSKRCALSHAREREAVARCR